MPRPGHVPGWFLIPFGGTAKRLTETPVPSRGAAYWSGANANFGIPGTARRLLSDHVPRPRSTR